MRRTILTLLLFTGAAPALAQLPPPPAPDGVRGVMLPGADTDGDGVVTRAEAMAAFDRIDANHDGAIDRGERIAMRGVRRGGPPRGASGDIAPPPPPQD